MGYGLVGQAGSLSAKAMGMPPLVSKQDTQQPIQGSVIQVVNLAIESLLSVDFLPIK